MYIEYLLNDHLYTIKTSLIYPMGHVYNWYIYGCVCVPDEVSNAYGVQFSYHNGTTITRQIFRTMKCELNDISGRQTEYIYWDIPRCSVYIHSSSATDYNNCPEVSHYYPRLPYKQRITTYYVLCRSKPTNMPLCSKTHAHCHYCTPYTHHRTRQLLPCNIAYNPCQDPFLPAIFFHSFIHWFPVLRVEQAKNQTRR